MNAPRSAQHTVVQGRLSGVGAVHAVEPRPAPQIRRPEPRKVRRPDVRLGPGDLEFAVALEQPLHVDECERDDATVGVVFDTVPFWGDVGVRRESSGVVSGREQIEDVAAFVVLVVCELDACNRDARRGLPRGSL